MGTFRRTIEVANIGRRSREAEVPNALVDTGSEYTWIPAGTLEGIGIKREKKDLAFLMANGQTVTRSTGFAIVRIGEAFTVDEVVFGEPGDQALLGARTLEGLNLTVDPARRRLVAAGPLPAASSFTVSVAGVTRGSRSRCGPDIRRPSSDRPCLAKDAYEPLRGQ